MEKSENKNDVIKMVRTEYIKFLELIRKYVPDFYEDVSPDMLECQTGDEPKFESCNTCKYSLMCQRFLAFATYMDTEMKYKDNVVGQMFIKDLLVPMVTTIHLSTEDKVIKSTQQGIEQVVRLMDLVIPLIPAKALANRAMSSILSIIAGAASPVNIDEGEIAELLELNNKISNSDPQGTKESKATEN